MAWELLLGLTKCFYGESLIYPWRRAKQGFIPWTKLWARYPKILILRHFIIEPSCIFHRLMHSNAERLKLGITEVTVPTDQLTHHLFTEQAQSQLKLENSNVNSHVAFIPSHFFSSWYAVPTTHMSASAAVIPYNLIFLLLLTDLVADDGLMTQDCPKVNILAYLRVRSALICEAQPLKFKVNYAAHHPKRFQKRGHITANIP